LAPDMLASQSKALKAQMIP